MFAPNEADNPSIVIMPDFLDNIHVYMRLFQPTTNSLSEVLDEMQAFVSNYYEGTHNPQNDAPQYQQHRQQGTFGNFEQKQIFSAIIGTIHIQSLERAAKAPGIFLLDSRISHISIEHTKSYKDTPWKTIVGDLKNTDTFLHFSLFCKTKRNIGNNSIAVIKLAKQY